MIRFYRRRPTETSRWILDEVEAAAEQAPRVYLDGLVAGPGWHQYRSIIAAIDDIEWSWYDDEDHLSRIVCGLAATILRRPPGPPCPGVGDLPQAIFRDQPVPPEALARRARAALPALIAADCWSSAAANHNRADCWSAAARRLREAARPVV